MEPVENSEDAGMVGTPDLENMMRREFPLAPDGLIAALLLSFLESAPPTTFTTDDGAIVENAGQLSATDVDPGLAQWMQELREAAGRYYPLPPDEELQGYRRAR